MRVRATHLWESRQKVTWITTGHDFQLYLGFVIDKDNNPVAMSTLGPCLDIYSLPMKTMKMLKLPRNRLHLQRISWWFGVNGKRFFAHFFWDVLCPRNEPTTTRASQDAKPLVDVSMKTWCLYLWNYSNWMQLAYVPLYLYKYIVYYLTTVYVYYMITVYIYIHPDAPLDLVNIY